VSTGTALTELDQQAADGRESVETVIIGGGQAGLSVGYYLAKHGRPFVILDANERTGDSWRQRWDSLLLFTPARYNGLPGMRFPAPSSSFVTKDDMADYLEAYAARFELPVRRGVTVDRLWRRGDGFVVSAGSTQIRADNVIVAMGNCQSPWVPRYAKELDPRIVQVHSGDYRNPAQLRDGGVLVVGAGNSGADIAIEVAQNHRTWMAGQESGHIPFRIETFAARHFALRVVRFVGHRVLTVRTPIGRKVRPKLLTTAAPLVRVKPKDLAAAGIERVPRVIGARKGLPLLEDDRALDVSNVIWCTGFRPGFSWIDLPILGDRQEPFHDRGVVAQEPGLYFVGLHFLYSMTSETITGVQRDAKRIAKQVASRRPAATRASDMQAALPA
jgi:putative flavoprotein involved in K+ transport